MRAFFGALAGTARARSYSRPRPFRDAFGRERTSQSRSDRRASALGCSLHEQFAVHRIRPGDDHALQRPARADDRGARRGLREATGIDVAVRNDDEDVFDAEIVAEGQRSPADVIFSENSPALEYLQGRDLLAPVDRPTLARTPGRYNSPQGDWVGISARVSVLIYNPGLINKSALPTRVLELADPRYRGELAFAAGETDFQPVVTSVLRTYGKATALKWLDGIKTNAGGHVYPDNETISAAVNRGIVAFGVVNQYYWYRMRAEVGAANIHSRIAYFAAARPWLCPRHLRSRDLEVVQAPGGCAEVPGLPRLRKGPGDHRPLDQLRVPDRVGCPDRAKRDAL